MQLVAPMAGVLLALSARLDRLRGRVLVVAPIAMGCGVGWYFALLQEPLTLHWVGLGAALVGLSLAGRRFGRSAYSGFGVAAYLLAFLVAGFLVSGLRTTLVAGPVLEFRYYGPVEGRITHIDRSGSDAVRLTLDQVRLSKIAPQDIPRRVRVSLHGPQGYMTPQPGMRVAMTAFLGAPNGPVEPGGFDFQRMAWFRGIGAVGYTRAPALSLAPAQGAALWVHRLRLTMSRAIQAVIPGDAGAFAAAIATGDRSQMGQQLKVDLRRANLAHLLAISGLHMGLLTGFIFAAVRAGLALVPGIGFRMDARKPAAIVALLAGFFYLALSGWAVSTERAFIMVAVMFGAILIGRRALTLRAVAVAALILLTLQPETLVEPGFQMSFAATAALVAVFGALRMVELPLWVPRWLRAVGAVVVSSFVAGLATAPFSAAHFNQVSQLGLIANVLSVPVMGALIMPLAVIAGVASLVGLAAPVLMVMRWPIEWVLGVARWVSGLEGAVGFVAMPPDVVLPLVALGGLALIVLRGAGRGLGIVPIGVALVIWQGGERPQVLISASGGLVGVMGAEGRVFNKSRGESFAARSWLENDGDPAAQSEAAARHGFLGETGDKAAQIGGVRLAHLTGRGVLTRVNDACQSADIVVISATWDGERPASCLLLDKVSLSQSGAVALRLTPEAAAPFSLLSTAQTRGARPWTRAP
ncbi:MAG: ComEC/Rec2 family competence protein [Maritimibacter sp.]